MSSEHDNDWQRLSLCRGMDTELFFDLYEGDRTLARNMDEICFSCMVRPICRQVGEANGETGLWGGVYLVNGKVNSDYNSHKTQEVWSQL